MDSVKLISDNYLVDMLGQPDWANTFLRLPNQNLMHKKARQKGPVRIGTGVRGDALLTVFEIDKGWVQKEGVSPLFCEQEAMLVPSQDPPSETDALAAALLSIVVDSLVRKADPVFPLSETDALAATLLALEISTEVETAKREQAGVRRLEVLTSSSLGHVAQTALDLLPKAVSPRSELTSALTSAALL